MRSSTNELLHSYSCQLLGLLHLELHFQLSTKIRELPMHNTPRIMEVTGFQSKAQQECTAQRLWCIEHPKACYNKEQARIHNHRMFKSHSRIWQSHQIWATIHLSSFQNYYCLLFLASHLFDAKVLAQRLFGICNRQFISSISHILLNACERI